jgi:aerobic-type carbon monoxide dehydrogenase small subunit (CoxS/CutS family)
MTRVTVGATREARSADAPSTVLFMSARQAPLRRGNRMPIELNVNGRRHRLDVDPERSLLSVLREELALTGSKYGCGEGQCGACTVLLDRAAVRSCRTTVAAAAGKPVVTIEGLERNGRLHPVQQAFIDANALQCGYCTAGMIMASVSLLERTPNPSTDDIVRGMDGNVCRCGTYPEIVAAIKRAASAGRPS